MVTVCGGGDSLYLTVCSLTRAHAPTHIHTGMGKTRVAVELVAALLPRMRWRRQLAVFLAPSVPLVRQVRKGKGA